LGHGRRSGAEGDLEDDPFLPLQTHLQQSIPEPWAGRVMEVVTGRSGRLGAA